MRTGVNPQSRIATRAALLLDLCKEFAEKAASLCVGRMYAKSM